MGKFTTSVFLFFSFMLFFTLDVQAAGKKASSCAAKVPAGQCYKTMPDGSCQFGVSLCETAAACNGKGTWDGSTCTPKQVQQVVVNGKKETAGASSCAADGGQVVRTKYTDPEDNQEYTKSVCMCNGQELPEGQKCGNSKSEGGSYSKNCTQRGGELRGDGCFCEATWLLLAPDETCEGSHSSSTMTVDQCIANFKTKVDKCASEANAAKKTCEDAKAGNSTIGIGKDMISMANQIFSMKKAGSGETNNCANVALGAYTALQGLDALKTVCDKEFDGCTAACDGLKLNVVASCSEYDPTQIYGPKLKDAEEELKATYDKATKVCKVETAEQKNELGSLLNDYSKSATQAKVCECQKVTGSTACANVATAAECLVGGSLYGSAQCAVYGDCSVGSASYSSDACVCARNGTCGTAAATTSTPTVAADTKASTFAAAGIPTVAGGGSSDFDIGPINSPKPVGTTEDAKTSGVNPGLSTGGGGGGGGGANAPSADLGGAPVGSGGEGEGSNSSGGVFGQIKSMFGLGGGSGGNSKTGAGGKAANNPDLSKWAKGAQKRCLASANECKQVNPANREIFDIMKDRYNKLAVPLDPYLMPSSVPAVDSSLPGYQKKRQGSLGQ